MRTFKDLHDLENPHIGLQDLKFWVKIMLNLNFLK